MSVGTWGYAWNDVFVTSVTPNTNYADRTTLQAALVGSDNRKTYMYFNTAWFPYGATVLSAYIRIFTLFGFTGATHLDVHAVTAPWKESTVTFNNQPTVTGANPGSVDVGSLAQHSAVDIPVTAMIQSACNGSPFYGVRVQCTATNAFRVWSSSEDSNPAYRP